MKIKKKIISKIKRKINKKKKISIKQVCKLLNIEIPNNLKKVKNNKSSGISFNMHDFKPNCILFCYNLNRAKDKEYVKKNALCIFSEQPVNSPNNIVVSDYLECTATIGSYIRKKIKSKVIVVTGSVGKTSTKELINSVLKEKYKHITSSIGNSNTIRMIIKKLNRISFMDKIYIQEFGIGTSKEIIPVCSRILNADIVVYTNILDAHIENYGSRENILKHKTMLSKYGKKDGLAIINYDDILLKNHEFSQKKLSYSLNNKNADYYASNIKTNNSGIDFVINDNVLKETLPAHINVLGEHNIKNAIIGYILGKQLKLSNEQILSGINKFKTSGMRQNLIKKGDYYIFADCYNATVDSIESAVKTIYNIENKNIKTKIAVIGDVLEQGDYTKINHEKIGENLTKYNLDYVYFYGENSKYAYEKHKKEKDNSFYYNDRKKLCLALKKVIKPNTLTLFKGSNGMHLADIIDNIYGTDYSDKSYLSNKFDSKVKIDKYLFYNFDNYLTLKENYIQNKHIDLTKINNIEKIGKNAFSNNKNIISIKLSSTITRIGDDAFNSSSIKEIKFNNNLKSIGKNAFYNCSNLEEISLPNELIFIEENAFAECKNLKEITISKHVNLIEKNCFLNCNNLVIKCHKNSYAYKYAIDNNLDYELID